MYADTCDRKALSRGRDCRTVSRVLGVVSIFFLFQRKRARFSKLNFQDLLEAAFRSIDVRWMLLPEKMERELRVYLRLIIRIINLAIVELNRFRIES